MNYTVYVLKDRHDRIYIGQTQNLEKRLIDHNSGRTKSLHGRNPFQLVYTEEFKTRTKAVKKERALKSGQGRAWLKDYMRNMGL